jgi:hypothetical protein
MAKPKKSSKPSPKKAVKVQDLKPKSNPKGGRIDKSSPLLAASLKDNR